MFPPDPDAVADANWRRKQALASVGLEAVYTPVIVVAAVRPLAREDTMQTDPNVPTAVHVDALSLDVTEILHAWVPSYARQLAAQCTGAGYMALSMHERYFAAQAVRQLPVLRLAGADVVALTMTAAPTDPTILSAFAPLRLTAAHQQQILIWRAELVAVLAARWPRATKTQCVQAVDAKYPALKAALPEAVLARSDVADAFDDLVDRYRVHDPRLSDEEVTARATARAIATHPAAYAKYRDTVTAPVRS